VDIQAALEPLPPGVTMHRWNLDDGVFMCSVVEFEGVMAALQQALPFLGLEINVRKTTVCGPGLMPATSLLRAATRLHLEEGTDVLGVPSKPPRWGPTWESLVQNLHPLARRLGAWQIRSPRMRNCLGPAKVQYALRTLPLRHGGLRVKDHGDPADHMERGDGHARLGRGMVAGHPAH